MMLKPLKPNSFWSLPFHSFLSSSLCLLLPSFLLLFSLLNCKYQVPFILFCYFCYYCYYIVVLVIFFFSSRPVQQRPDCLSSVAVCKYNFISVPCSGGEKQNKMFHFYSLFLHLSLHDFPLSPINVVITVLFIVLCYLRGVVGFFFLSPGVVKLRDYIFFFYSKF